MCNYVQVSVIIAVTAWLSVSHYEGNQPISEAAPQIDTLSGVSISFAALLAVLSTVLIVVIVLLVRGRARTLKELKSFRDNGQKQSDTYEEINLTSSAINTSENVAYYGHVSDSNNNATYAYLNI